MYQALDRTELKCQLRCELTGGSVQFSRFVRRLNSSTYEELFLTTKNGLLHFLT